MPYKDPEKQRDSARDWSRKNKDKFDERREWFRKFLLEVKSGPCSDCGNKFPVECMDFDHRDGETKRFSISKMKTHNEVRIREEIAKCDLVCANCHRIRTTKRGQRDLGGSAPKVIKRRYRYEGY